MEHEIVCVTGAGGFIASWLVKLMLSKGYTVHATCRDPDDEKNAHLKNLDGALDKLKLFKADLLDYDAVAAAIAGCKGVFHVASPVAIKVPKPEIDLIAPAVTGTLNVLKACSEANVKKVVVVSSTAAVAMNPNWPEDKVMDEECWSDVEYCKKTENWYYFSKTLAEREALDYAAKHGLDLVTICPSMVFGPLLQSTINASSSFFVNILKGKIQSVEDKLWNFVDARDVADALLLVYEKPEASGRYICVAHRIQIREMMDMLKSMYPDYRYPIEYTKAKSHWESTASSEKLKMLGWKCRPLKDTAADAVECYKKAGLLDGE